MADRKSTTKSHCYETCRYSLCEECILKHSTDVATKYRNLGASPDMFDGYRSQCILHAGKILWSWCLTCLLPVCQECLTYYIHESHEIVDIETEYRLRKGQSKISYIITSIRGDILPRCDAMNEQRSKEFFALSLKNIRYQICQPEKSKNIIDVALKINLSLLRICQRTIAKQKEILHHFIKSMELVSDEERAFERPVSYLKALKKVSFVYDKDYLDPSVKLETKLTSNFPEDDTSIKIIVFKSHFSPMQFPEDWLKRNEYTNDPPCFCEACRYSVFEAREVMHFWNALDTDYHDIGTCLDCFEEFHVQCKAHPETEALIRWCRVCKLLVCPECVIDKKHKKHEIVDIESEYRLQRKQIILLLSSFIADDLLPKCHAMEKQSIKKIYFFSRENLELQKAFLVEKLKNINNVALKRKLHDIRQNQLTFLKQSEILLHFIKSLEIVLDEERAFETPRSFLVALKEYYGIKSREISIFEENIIQGIFQNYFLSMDCGACLELISEEELIRKPTHISPYTKKKIWVNSSGTLYVHDFSFKYQKYEPIKDVCRSENGVFTVRKSKQPMYIDMNGNLKLYSLLTNFTSTLPLKRRMDYIMYLLFTSQ